MRPGWECEVPSNKGLDLTVGRMVQAERPPAGQSRCSTDPWKVALGTRGCSSSS
jgi:hypothetical protein